MHRYRRFPRACHPLHNQICFGRLPDNLVLFFLNRRNNFSQNCLFAFCQILCQQIVVRHHIRIIKIFQSVVFDLIRALSFQIDGKAAFVFYLIRTRPERIFIIYRSNRRSPVYNKRIRVAPRDAGTSDIIRFGLRLFGIFKIDPSKICA